MVSCSAVLMLLGILRGRLRGSKQWKLMAYAFSPISEFLGFRRLQRCSAMLSAMCLGWKQWTWTSAASACHEAMHRETRLREIRPRCWTNDHWKGWLQRAEQSNMPPQLLGVTCWSSMKFNCWSVISVQSCGFSQQSHVIFLSLPASSSCLVFLLGKGDATIVQALWKDPTAWVKSAC